MNIIKLKRPKLNKINLENIAVNRLNGTSGKTQFFITMSPGQWDNFLEEAYYRQNATLIEIDSKQHPIAAYKNNQK